MARRIFDTYHAPEEEIAGVKAALDEAAIDWYETTKGRWWVGSAALWVRNSEDHKRARDVIDRFQSHWVEQQRAAPAPTGVRWNRVPVLIIVIGVLLYLLGIGFWL